MWGDRRQLGHEKETACIVSWEGMYVGRSMRLGEIVCIVSGEGEYVRRSIRLGHENEAVCMGCMWGDRGWVAENKGVCIVSGMCIWGDRRR
jgi:hypothetical protein